MVYRQYQCFFSVLWGEVEGGLKVPLPHPWAGADLVGLRQKDFPSKHPCKPWLTHKSISEATLSTAVACPDLRPTSPILKTEKGDINNPSVPNEF